VIAEFERYHELVLREMIVQSSLPLLIERFDSSGRVNRFRVNRRLGILIKHSAKRLPPWLFAFADDASEDVLELSHSVRSVWIALVCGSDGVVTVSLDEFKAVAASEDMSARFLRVVRSKNQMYRVHGNCGTLAPKARGVALMLTDATGTRGNADVA